MKNYAFVYYEDDPFFYSLFIQYRVSLCLVVLLLSLVWNFFSYHRSQLVSVSVLTS
jgi:hypothetical protein